MQLVLITEGWFLWKYRGIKVLGNFRREGSTEFGYLGISIFNHVYGFSGLWTFES